jgi:hypothetical protein
VGVFSPNAGLNQPSELALSLKFILGMKKTDRFSPAAGRSQIRLRIRYHGAGFRISRVLACHLSQAGYLPCRHELIRPPNFFVC